MALRIIYTFFLGILVALFVGLGISAFYPAPKMPEYPTLLEHPAVATLDGKPVEETAEMRAARVQYEKESKEYRDVTRPRYERNVAIIAMVSAIIVLIISLTAATKIDLLSDGLLLGGVLTLLYAIIRVFMGNDNKYSFVVVTVGLVIALILGFVKFIHPERKRK